VEQLKKKDSEKKDEGESDNESVSADENSTNSESNAEEQIKEKKQELMSKLKLKFEKVFWRYYDLEDIDDFIFTENLFTSPPEAVTKSYELKSEWTKCKELFLKYENLEKEMAELELLKKGEEIFNVKNLKVLRNKIPDDKLRKIISYHFRFNKIPLFEACSEETKKALLTKIFAMGTHSVLFTFKAAQLFINKECMDKLSSNYCIIGDEESEAFVKALKKTNEKVTGYKHFVEEIGLPDFYTKDYTEFDGFIQSIILSTDQKYTYYKIQDQVRNLYDKELLKDLSKLKSFTLKESFNSKDKDHHSSNYPKDKNFKFKPNFSKTTQGGRSNGSSGLAKPVFVKK